MLSYDRALHALRTWLDSWSGIGHVAVGMARQGYDLQLTRYDEKGWRATFYTTEMEHSPTGATGTDWERAVARDAAGGMGSALREAARDYDNPGGAMFDLKGRVAIVTGGNGGIGLGMARGLASAGARVVIAARNAEKSRAAVDELARLGAAEPLAIEVDVADESSVASMVGQAAERCGRIDVLVNNAGIQIRGKQPQDYSLAEWHRILDTNLTSGFLCARAVHPVFKRVGGGKIINIGSLYSFFSSSTVAAYSASKGGLVQFTKSLAVAWARDNVQVNAVLPGWIDTDLTRGARQHFPDLNNRVLRRTPAGRWGVIDDFAGIAVFLASGASDFITGAVITVDGGYTVQG
jgi:2-deoxy-D-gluconate 3-dehydrogenase